MINIVNLTPHNVRVNEKEYPSAGIARVSEEFISAPGGFYIRKTGKVENLPTQKWWDGETKGATWDTYREARSEAGNGVIPVCYYIVSSMVAQHLPDRHDLLIPADFVRDENGNIVACKKLIIANPIPELKKN
jgi:hypothetical protein